VNFVCRPLLICCAAWASVSCAEEVRYARPELLIEPAELAQSNATSHLVILDARKREDFDLERIPGARWVDHDTWKSAFDDGVDVEGWSKRIGELGIGKNSQVVVYDEVQSTHGARIWWTLRYWGLDDVRFLNGGWKAWKAMELPTTSAEADPVTAVEFRATPRTGRLTKTDQILDSLAINSLQVVDARSEDEFCGIDIKENARGGAIPTAKNLTWSDLLDPETDKFKTAAELKRLLDEAEIDLNKPTASHCHSGGRASVMALALDLMGAKDIRNYYRGWSEWGNREDTPIVVPDVESADRASEQQEASGS
jgi:thiosulfate/3-mercaptopyruvate sulfurtransferase